MWRLATQTPRSSSFRKIFRNRSAGLGPRYHVGGHGAMNEQYGKASASTVSSARLTECVTFDRTVYAAKEEAIVDRTGILFAHPVGQTARMETLLVVMYAAARLRTAFGLGPQWDDLTWYVTLVYALLWHKHRIRGATAVESIGQHKQPPTGRLPAMPVAITFLNWGAGWLGHSASASELFGASASRLRVSRKNPPAACGFGQPRDGLKTAAQTFAGTRFPGMIFVLQFWTG